MKTLSLLLEQQPGAERTPGPGSDLGARRLTMRRGTNSSGPDGLVRRVLRMGLPAGLVMGLVLSLGAMRADAQSHPHGGHFSSGAGGWHGGRAVSGWGSRSSSFNFNRGRSSGFGDWQNRDRQNRSREDGQRRGYYARGAMRQEQGTRSQMQMRGGSFRQARPEYRRPYAGQNSMNRTTRGAEFQQGRFQNTRPGQEHLPQWWAAHRGLSPQQQAEAMRREPGFQSLPRAQQQRLLGTLRRFDARPPQVQQRLLNRVEMFERLSPERQQEVRGASAAFNHMPPQQKQRMIRAFQQLRHMPPVERQEMLHSAYGQQFTPRERTVLGNLLSIEPYQPSASAPYFGRPH